jgi:hypothetical protein
MPGMRSASGLKFRVPSAAGWPAGNRPARRSYPALMSIDPAGFLQSVAVGRRVVARYRIPGGFTDALGYVRHSDESACVIETRRGQVVVPLVDVVAAKAVPEPPPRRAPGDREGS